MPSCWWCQIAQVKLWNWNGSKRAPKHGPDTNLPGTQKSGVKTLFFNSRGGGNNVNSRKGGRYNYCHYPLYILPKLKCGSLDLVSRSFLSDWLFLTKTGDKATGWQGIFYLFWIVINYYGLAYLKHPMPCAQYIFVEWMNKLCILYYTGVFHTRAYVLWSQKPCVVRCKKMAANQDVYPIWNKILLFLPRKGGICFFSHLGLGWPLINEVQ